MNKFFSNIIDDARRAPSVLNSQPWRLRVCGNTIEVYLEKRSELEPVDSGGRLQVASCGTLIAHLENAFMERGRSTKVTYFPRFEEQNLVAFIEASGTAGVKSAHGPAVTKTAPALGEMEPGGHIKEEIASLAARKEIGLVIHDDRSERKIQTYLKKHCSEKLNSEQFRKSLNLFLRSDTSEASIPFEDEVLMSDRFFDFYSTDGSNSEVGQDPTGNEFIILTTGSDNRFDWIRAGEVLGNVIIRLRNKRQSGLMALPIISNDNCREWLQKELNLSGFPQFVLRAQQVRPTEHKQKRPLKEVLKYGF